MSSASVTLRAGGGGRRHQIQSRASARGRAACARTSADVAQSADAGAAIRSGGMGASLRTATTNSRGRDCGVKCAASIVSAPKR